MRQPFGKEEEAHDVFDNQECRWVLIPVPVAQYAIPQVTLGINSAQILLASFLGLPEFSVSQVSSTFTFDAF